MSEDISKEPISAPRTELPVELTDYPSSDYLEAPWYPWQMTAAGVLWIVLSVLMLLFVGVLAASMIARANGANAGGGNGGAPSSNLLMWLGFIALAGLSLLVYGVRCIRGVVRKLVFNAVASIGFGLFDIGWVVYRAAGGQLIHANIGLIILIGFEGLAGLLLLTAGALALMGRSKYEQWLTTRKPDSIQRSRLTGQIVCVGDERLLKESPANLIRGWAAVGGWLYLTDKRLVFRPHGFNLRKQENTRFNVNKNELSIPLSEIEEAGAHAFLGVIPTSLRVTTSLGVRTFVVQPRGAWLKAIEDARGFDS